MSAVDKLAALSRVLAGLAALGAGGMLLYNLRALLKSMGPENARQDEAAHANRQRLQRNLQSRGRSAAEAARLAALDPSPQELAVLSEVVFPEQLHTSFADIGGHESLKRDLYESILLPLQQPHLFKQLHAASSLLSVPAGILFYGPPGTGKTLMARAIAKSSGATFINVRPSTLLSKWVGESQKLIRAVFSVAQLYAPSIIFMDECDAFMSKRSGADAHEGHAQMRSEFLGLWDGLTSASASQGDAAGGSVIVLACSNRPWDIDEAFLRRMPRSFLLPLPSKRERRQILTLLLQDSQLAEVEPEDAGSQSDAAPAAAATASSSSASASASASAPSFSRSHSLVRAVARLTEGYSGSDLKEVCRVAAALPLRKLMQQHTRDNYQTLMEGGRKRDNGRRKGAEQEVAAEAAQQDASAVPSVPPSEPSLAAPAASLSSSSAAVPAPPAFPLSAPRPLQLSDFRAALRAVRPSATGSSSVLLAFEKRHRGAQGAALHAEGREEEEAELNSDSDAEASEKEEDECDATPRARRAPTPAAARPHGSFDGADDSDDGIYD